MEKYRILVIGHSREGFGFGRVLQSILHRLNNQYDIHQFERSSSCISNSPWPVYSNQRADDPLGLQQLPSLVEKINPHIIFLLAEIWDVPQYTHIFCNNNNQTKIVAYCPVDGNVKPYLYLERLNQLSKLVVYTEFARQEILNGFENLNRSGIPAHPPDISIIPHGVDTKIFYPYTFEGSGISRQELRSQLFPKHSDIQNAFIVLNANRNQSRKRIDLTLKGFSIFAANKPKNVLLCLHMGLIDEGINILGLAKTYDISERLIFSTKSKRHPVVTNCTLNQIYNACDVGLNTSMGEGWGLVSFEHAATGAAQIVPRHSACEELWENSAVMLDTVPIDTGAFPLSFRAASATEIANALESLYSNPQLLQIMSKLAYDNSTSPNLHWNSVSTQFDNLFNDLLHPEIPNLTFIPKVDRVKSKTASIMPTIATVIPA